MRLDSAAWDGHYRRQNNVLLNQSVVKVSAGYFCPPHFSATLRLRIIGDAVERVLTGLFLFFPRIPRIPRFPPELAETLWGQKDERREKHAI